MGNNALGANTTANYNIGIGDGAGDAITTGSNNTIIGYQAGTHDVNLTTGGNNVIVGQYSDVSASDVSNEVVVGNNMTGKGADTGFFGGTNGAYNEANSANWSTTSDERIKKNISDNSTGLSKLNQIQVRSFEYRTPEEVTELPKHAAVDKEGAQVGVIAQEIETVLPDVVKEESTGAKTVNPENITWYLVNAIQELSAEVEELKAQPKCKCQGD